MEVVKKMNVPTTYLYGKIIDSVLYDIRNATGADVSKKQLKNYEYVKEFSKASRAKIKIEDAVENQKYRFRTSTTRNEYVVEYDIKPLTDKSCELHYTETMESFGFFQKMNDISMGLLLSFFKKRQFKKMLKAIEESY